MAPSREPLTLGGDYDVDRRWLRLVNDWLSLQLNCSCWRHCLSDLDENWTDLVHTDLYLLVLGCGSLRYLDRSSCKRFCYSDSGRAHKEMVLVTEALINLYLFLWQPHQRDHWRPRCSGLDPFHADRLRDDLHRRFYLRHHWHNCEGYDQQRFEQYWPRDSWGHLGMRSISPSSPIVRFMSSSSPSMVTMASQQKLK